MLKQCLILHFSLDIRLIRRPSRVQSDLLKDRNFTDSSSILLSSHRYTQAGLQFRTTMALTNFILTVAGVSAVVLLLRSDVKKSAVMFRRNVRQIRQWLEEESSVANKKTDGEKMKELPKGEKD